MAEIFVVAALFAIAFAWAAWANRLPKPETVISPAEAKQLVQDGEVQHVEIYGRSYTVLALKSGERVGHPGVDTTLNEQLNTHRVTWTILVNHSLTAFLQLGIALVVLIVIYQIAKCVLMASRDKANQTVSRQPSIETT